MDNIAQKCRQRMDDLHLSTRGVANAADIPEATVRNFVGGLVKSPAADTVGKLCAVLGISLDEHYNIHMPGPKESESQVLIRDLNQEIIRLEELGKEHQEQIASLRKIVRALFALCFLLAFGAFAYLLAFDLSNPSYGIFRW